jgi:glycosyltransferase involved in cell wall biosynthesis
MNGTRVALCVTELDVGGAERCLVQLALGLRDRGWRPAVFCLAPRPAAPLDVLPNQLEAGGVPVHFLGGRGLWQARRVLAKLERSFREFQPKLVQDFLFHANVLGTLAARRAGVPIITTGIRVAEPRWWHAWVFRATAARANRHVCVSQAVADYWSRRAGISREACRVIPNGINAEAARRVRPADLAEFGIPADGPALIAVGRLDRQKGTDLLLSHAKNLLNACPEHHIILVGDGPLRRDVEAASRDSVHGGRLHYLGWREDALSFVAASDLLLLPSRWEGMPNVMLEAMALGKPVIAFAVEGVAELLGAEADCQLVPPGDMSKFIAAAARIVRDPDLAGRFSTANLARAEREFSLERMIDAYGALYEDLLSGRT